MIHVLHWVHKCTAYVQPKNNANALKKKKDQYILFSNEHVPGAGMHLYKYNFLVLSVSVNHEFLFSDAGEKSIL